MIARTPGNNDADDSPRNKPGALLLPGFPSALQNRFQVGLEPLQHRDSLRCGLKNLFLVDEDLSSSPLDQWPKTLAHAPANIAQDLETIWPRHEKCQAAIAQYANSLRKTLKCLEIKAGNVELLKLLSRIKHEFF
jgi:hypothetical protein